MTPDFAVVGRGLWGTAAAMYLARAGHSVALIGPSEPKDRAVHDAPFASHYDAGRITRSIDRDALWARASARSIARYGALAEDSGISFYTACGGMMALPDAASASAVARIAGAEGYPIDQLSGKDLADRFPEFTFAPNIHAIWDATGGVIDPRAMRRAHEVLAKRAGAAIFDSFATRIEGGSVQLAADGERIEAGHIVLATGGYAGLSGLLPRKLCTQVFARTVYFAEVTEAEARRLQNMPSLIWEDFYLLAPVRYPDGSLRLKIGGDPVDIPISSTSEARDWMRTDGNPAVADRLRSALLRLMPDLQVVSGSHDACLLAYSSTGYPYVGRVSDHLTIATACCGAGAKNADEFGRLAACAAMGGVEAPNALGQDLAPRFL